jgi:hypothetical protein
MTTAAIDNDILLKGLCYDLLLDFLAAIPSSASHAGVLGAARYVVASRLRRANLSGDLGEVLRRLDGFFRKAVILEPTDEESRMAAEIEFAAQQENVELDIGESQLCAIVTSRQIPWIVTGDKRAIRALGALVSHVRPASGLIGKVICLEQLVLAMIVAGDANRIRDRVCGESKVDRSLAICFSCSDPLAEPESWAEGLRSYVDELRRSGKQMLRA